MSLRIFLLAGLTIVVISTLATATTGKPKDDDEGVCKPSDHKTKNATTTKMRQNKGKASGGATKDGDVFTITDANYDATVLKSDKPWMVAYSAPWCGYCKKLTPEWKSAATALKGKASLGTVNCDENPTTCRGVKGYPTIKFFKTGKGTPEEYRGHRTSKDIVSYVTAKIK